MFPARVGLRLEAKTGVQGVRLLPRPPDSSSINSEQKNQSTFNQEWVCAMSPPSRLQNHTLHHYFQTTQFNHKVLKMKYFL